MWTKWIEGSDKTESTTRKISDNETSLQFSWEKSKLHEKLLESQKCKPEWNLKKKSVGSE